MVNYAIKIFYKIYFTRFSIQWIDIKYHHLCIKIINKVFPRLYRFSDSTGTSSGNKLNQYVVSLTTFPARIDKVWIVIESLLRQTHAPDSIFLWLSKEEFPVKEDLPQKLRQLEKRGLQIRFCSDNLMPHKKYFYTMQEFPGSTVITVDDDMIYPPDLLSNLISAHKKYPGSICSTITRSLKTADGKLLPYNNWYYVNINREPSFNLLPIGAGGTLFPPHALSPQVFNITHLKSIALKADDLWLKIMSLLNKTKVAGIAGEYPRFFVPVIQKNNQRLMDDNIWQGQNDAVFSELINYYNIPVSIFEKD